MQEMREEIYNDPSVPVRRIYDAVITAHHRRDNNLQEMPQFEAVRSALNRTRELVVPPVPRNLESVVIPLAWRDTWRNEDFVLNQDNQLGIIIFATQADIAILQRCNKIFMDGTFRTAPHPYRQCFTLHGLVNNHVLKFCCVLLASKTQAIYQRILQILKAQVRNVTGEDFGPARIVIDFEVALIQELRRELPGSRIDGCFFHFCKAIWRHIQQLGLSGPYMANAELKTLLRSVMALGFLPVNFVRISYRNLQEAEETHDLVQQFPAIEQFFAYFLMPG